MWRLWHKLFGWHYIHWWNTTTEKISKVHYTPDGRPYIVYFSGYLKWLRPDGTMHDGACFIPLTFKLTSDNIKGATK